MPSEVLKEFPRSKEIMGFILPQQDIQCRGTLNSILSALGHVYMTQNFPAILFFFGGGVDVNGTNVY